MGKNTKSINGFASQAVLLVFLALLQLLSLISLYCVQNASLKEADRINQFELAIVQEAKEIIEHNARIRQCHWDESKLEIEKKVQIENEIVWFLDRQTYLEVRSSLFEGTIFYSGSRIEKVEYGS